jgi:hypothetical protein
MHVEINDGNFVIDAAVVGDLLDVPAAEVPALMRNQAITSVCESGIDVDQGMFRLNFYYRTRHAKIRVDRSGNILQRSVIDFGKRPAAPARRRFANPMTRRDSDSSAA